jgi:hypothetical protein
VSALKALKTAFAVASHFKFLTPDTRHLKPKT